MDRSRFMFNNGRLPVPVQVAIIILAFAIGLAVITVILTKLDQPANTPPAATGTGN